MKKLLALSFLSALAMASPAVAQVQCVPDDKVEAALKDQHGELRLFEGMAENGATVQLYWNPKTGTWTLVMLPANMPGAACLVVSGEDGSPARPALKGAPL